MLRRVLEGISVRGSFSQSYDGLHVIASDVSVTWFFFYHVGLATSIWKCEQSTLLCFEKNTEADPGRSYSIIYISILMANLV